MDVCMYGWVTSFFGFGGCLLKEERRDLLSLGNFLFLGGKAREQNFAFSGGNNLPGLTTSNIGGSVKY